MAHCSTHSSRSTCSRTIVLYDTPGQTAQPWAPNIWRIRFILNYKRLPYRTQWVDFQDIESALRRINAPPSSKRSNGSPVYTLPIIIDPSGHTPQILSNPNIIAEYLETTYPNPPVFPEGSRALQTMFVHYIQEVFARPLLPIMVPLSHQHVRSSTPGPLRGAPSSDHERAWAQVKEQFNFLATILDKNSNDGVGDGVVVMSNELSYADFSLCSVLVWMEKMVAREAFAQVMEWNGGRWARLRQRCGPYMGVY